MTHFAALIERAIARDLRSRFEAFLRSYQLVNDGCERRLTVAEIALVLACKDQFLLCERAHNLGVAQIASLRTRLDALASSPTRQTSDSLIANTCFDALAVITALEARLCRLLDRAEAILASRASAAELAANDN